LAQLSDLAVHTKLKLAALWASTMFCYIYCDYFQLYVPGKLDGMLQGNMGPLGAVTQETLMGTAILMAIPSLMIFLSLALPARLSRILNIVFGAFFTLLLALITYTVSWYFYKLFAAIEVVLTALVVWYAWRWPRVESAA
jgi:hypothetical protein